MSWKESLPEDMRENKAFEGIDSIENLAKQHIDHMQYQGNSIRLPDADASQDAMNEFYGKMAEKVPGLMPTPNSDDPAAMKAMAKLLGVPDEVGGYKVPEAANNFDGVNSLLTIAHDSGLTQTQFDKVITGILSTTIGQQEGNQEQFDKDSRALKIKWGVTYEDNIELAKNTLAATKAPDELQLMAANGKLPSQTLEWLHQIGSQLGAEGINAQKNDETTRVSPAEAKSQIDTIMSDKDHPYWHPEKPGHDSAKTRVNELHAAAYR